MCLPSNLAPLSLLKQPATGGIGTLGASKSNAAILSITLQGREGECRDAIMGWSRSRMCRFFQPTQ